MTKPWVLLFDVDGTLIRTGGAGIRAMRRGFMEVLGWPDALTNVSLAGMTDMGIAHQEGRRHLGRMLTPEELEAAFARYLVCLREELDAAADFRVLPGVREFLAARHLDPRFLLALGTGNLEAGARIKLEHADLMKFFVCGGYGSDALLRPDVLRAGVRRAEALLGAPVAPERVIVIGDTPLDVAAGQAVGARTLAVATGPFAVEVLRESGASAVAPDLASPEAEKFFSDLR